MASASTSEDSFVELVLSFHLRSSRPGWEALFTPGVILSLYLASFLKCCWRLANPTFHIESLWSPQKQRKYHTWASILLHAPVIQSLSQSQGWSLDLACPLEAHVLKAWSPDHSATGVWQKLRDRAYLEAQGLEGDCEVLVSFFLPLLSHLGHEGEQVPTILPPHWSKSSEPLNHGLKLPKAVSQNKWLLLSYCSP